MLCPNCGHPNNIPGAEECEQCHQDLTQFDQPAAQDQVERHLMEDPVRTMRLRAPVAVRPTTTISSAIQTMLDHNIGAVLVVDERGALVGIFSERDLLTRVAGLYDDFGDKAVSEFMTENPETVSCDDRLAFAAHKMAIGGYRHIPVLTNGTPSGVLSIRDMIRFITRIGSAT
jgi:CBS domain-containing protein